MLAIDTRKHAVRLKTTDNWRKRIEQLRTEAIKEEEWEYIDPDQNRMVLEPAPLRPTEPQEPIITEANRADALLLWQEYQVKWRYTTGNSPDMQNTENV